MTDTSPPSRFVVSPTANFASSWSADGRSIVSVRIDPATRNDLWLQRVQDGAAQGVSFNTSFNESQGKVGGGTSPQWAGSKEILYISGNSQLMAAAFTEGQTDVNVGSPHALFSIPNVAEIDRLLYPTANTFVPTSNGQHVLVAVRASDANAPPINIVVNWRALLNR
jgi:hypothetical protein